MTALDGNAVKLIDEPNLAFLATVDEDGSPQVTPVWIDREDGTLLVNTAVGRVKDRNMRRDPRVAISVANRNDPYDRVDIRGRVVEVVEGAEAEGHIDRLSRKYLGEDTYPWRRDTEARVVFKVRPERVYVRG